MKLNSMTTVKTSSVFSLILLGKINFFLTNLTKSEDGLLLMNGGELFRVGT